MIHKKMKKRRELPAAFCCIFGQSMSEKEETGGTAISAVPLIFCTSMTVSRVLYLTVIYLRAALPRYSSHPGSGRANLYAPIPVLLRIEFTASDSLQPMGELLPRLSTLTSCPKTEAVYFCCTGLGVTSTGRYPASCPMEPGLSSPADVAAAITYLTYAVIRVP